MAFWFLFNLFWLLTSLALIKGQKFCGNLTVHKEKWFHEATVLDTKNGISLDNCIIECCNIEECTAIGYLDFMIATDRSRCSLLFCDKKGGCTVVDRPSNNTGLISIWLTRTTETNETLLVNSTKNKDEVADVQKGTFGTIVKSCSSVIGVAIFLAVFCTAINLGLIANLMTSQRRSTHTLHSTTTTAARNGPPPTDKVHAAKHSETLHAYNDVVVGV